ncbi:MAG: cystathionine beta-lyase [Rhodospirillaceae bacterium]|nr:cystathionine beta-lyase [Rhodospirillaceae bacterium]
MRELETRCAELEAGEVGFAFASGPAAMVTVLDMLDAGAHVIAMDDFHGPTYRLFETVRRRSSGLDISFLDPLDIDQLAGEIRDETRMIWVQRLTQPYLRPIDLEAIAGLAKDRDLTTVCDNGPLTGAASKPLDQGFDISVYSSVSQLSGNPDLRAGLAVIAAGRDFAQDKLAYLRNALGTDIGRAEEADLSVCLDTLTDRASRQYANAGAVANFLSEHPSVERVFYSGEAQVSSFVSAIVSNGMAGARRLIDRTTVIQPARYLGGERSVIEHPASMSHEPIPAEVRAALDIPDGLVRLSLGTENTADIVAGLKQAFD